MKVKGSWMYNFIIGMMQRFSFLDGPAGKNLNCALGDPKKSSLTSKIEVKRFSPQHVLIFAKLS